MRRSNPENIGEPVYPWWRPKGYECVLAGYEIGLYQLAAIWHNEPRGADSGTHCKHYETAADGRITRSLNGWRWHVHHWSVQVHPWQILRRWLFDRCGVCGFRFPWNYSPVTFQWDPKLPPWWKFWQARTHAMHDKCASLRSMERDSAIDREIVKLLVDECGLRAGETEAECLKRLCRSWEFRPGYRLIGLMKHEWDEEHTKLVKRETVS